MSDNVPFDIQERIIKRVLGVKPLLRFRSVSKKWKSLIDSSKFITHHNSLNKNQPQNLLVRYCNILDYDLLKYVSIVDDDSFPQHKSPLVVPPAVKRVRNGLMLDSSHGLVCLYGQARSGNSLVVLWNPSIRKSLVIKFPFEPTAIGFAVCPKTSDPKIVRIKWCKSADAMKAELFTLSSGAWRSISTDMHPPIPTQFTSNQIVIDEVIYWATFDMDRDHAVILSFNMTSEEFREVELPDCLARKDVVISKLKESLVVLHVNIEKVCEVWIMKNSGFVKLFSVCNDPYPDFEVYTILGFRKNGEVIRADLRGSDDGSLLKLKAFHYEPSTICSNDLGIIEALYPNLSNFMMTSYTESLLLLNHSGSIIQR